MPDQSMDNIEENINNEEDISVKRVEDTQNFIQTERQELLVQKMQSMKDNASSLESADDNVGVVLIGQNGQKLTVVENPSKMSMTETFMDLMMLQKQKRVELNQETVLISKNSGTRKAQFAQLEI